MSLFSWKPEYSVNYELLDKHHQHLFAILNSVYENVMNSPELDCVLPKINELSEYTKYHFLTEEQYMREKGFSGLDDHIAKHREFTNNIETLRMKFHHNDLEVAKNLIVLLGEWLLQHVLREDMKYSGLANRVRN
jgi:hemerythrin